MLIRIAAAIGASQMALSGRTTHRFSHSNGVSRVANARLDARHQNERHFGVARPTDFGADMMHLNHLADTNAWHPSQTATEVDGLATLLGRRFLLWGHRGGFFVSRTTN